MSNKVFPGNFENKSEIIRRVFEANPIATNLQIKTVVAEAYGIDVSGQLIIAAIGKYKNRIATKNPSTLIAVAKKYLAEFSSDVGQASYWLRRAA